MFILTTISDLVQIPPHEFYRPDMEEISDKINEKYSNKVIQNIGLCVAMYDLLTASDGLISHETGNVNVKVTFRLLVFRPPRSTILLARITHQTRQGIHLSTEFFDDIHVPASLLFPNSVFEPEEGVWVWHNNAGGNDDDERNPENGIDDNGEDQLYFDNGNTVRFRVEAEFWTDQAPDGSKKPAAVAGLPGGGENGNGGEQQQQRKVPWRLEGSMAEPGLGDVMWW